MIFNSCNSQCLQFTVLVANKREGVTQVDPEMARTFAQQHDLGFAEVDLPSGSGVEELFNDVIGALLRKGSRFSQPSTVRCA